MKKSFALVAIVTSLVLISLVPIGNAYLNVSVSVLHSTMNPFESQIITVTTNEGGNGVLFVAQPNEGTSWINFINNHPTLKSLWNSLPWSIRTEILDQTGKKIVSFAMVSMNVGGGSKSFTFPQDFTGINGNPSTAPMGRYKVIFAFISLHGIYDDTQYAPTNDNNPCCLCCADFDCGKWFVVPEVPFGTIISLLSAVIAIPTLGLYKRKHLSKKN